MTRLFRVFRMFRRWFERAVPSHYTSRRDRLSDEADRLTNANQFRSGE
jgi:hypothetical protein